MSAPFNPAAKPASDVMLSTSKDACPIYDYGRHCYKKGACACGHTDPRPRPNNAPRNVAKWMAAGQALSLAHRELWNAVLDAPYDRLPDEWRNLRIAYDRAKDQHAAVQRERERSRVE